ncbi:hypothetical protein BH18ACT13_BH18ACT13_18800 [soil metagenome]
MPPGAQRGLRAREHEPALVGRELKKENEHEVERSGLRLEVEQIDGAEVDLDLLADSACPPLRDRHFGEVDRSDAPAERREPDGMPALSAREVERSSGGETSHFLDGMAIRLAAPELLLLAILAVPGLTLHLVPPALPQRCTSRPA